MDFALSEQQIAFVDVAREFARDQLAPNAANWDEQKIFPVATIRAAGDLGFCGFIVLQKSAVSVSPAPMLR